MYMCRAPSLIVSPRGPRYGLSIHNCTYMSVSISINVYIYINIYRFICPQYGAVYDMRYMS